LADIPPPNFDPDDPWSDLTLTLSAQDDGTFSGVLTMRQGSAIPLHWQIEGWHKAATGVVKARIRAEPDHEWREYLRRQDMVLRGG